MAAFLVAQLSRLVEYFLVALLEHYDVSVLLKVGNGPVMVAAFAVAQMALLVVAARRIYEMLVEK